MFWTNVKLIFFREARDQLRDRRTLFTVLVLPLLLYPLMGALVFQVQQFLREHPSKVRLVGTAGLPEEPALVVDGKLAEKFGDASRLEVEVVPQTNLSFDELRRQAETDIRLGLCDAVVYFPADFAKQLAEFHDGTGKSPRPIFIRDTAKDKSKIASQRIDVVIDRWNRSLVKQNLEQSHISAAAASPFETDHVDVAQPARRRAAMWSKILPFILMIWALTGAFYPAIDLCAGEKERGTLETLLTSPAARSEIVCGKLLTVMTFSMATAVLNLVSMTATGAFVAGQLQRMGSGKLPLAIGSPPLEALVWLLVALVPISALFSALALAIAAFARSSKEGHYYMMPLLMLSLPLMMLSIFPGAELDLGFSLIPLSGLLMLLRTLIEGQYWEALRYIVPVVGMTAVCCWLAIRWAVHQFNDESVLFRESERFGLRLWLRHLLRDREDLPTAGEAVFCGLLILVIRFFFSLIAPQPTSWGVLATTTLALLVTVAAPACLMAVMLTRRPGKTLLLCRPSFWMTVPAAALLAAALHPVLLWLNEGIRLLYPINPEAIVKLREIEGMFSSAPLWQALLVVALAPAICEELAFRGFILSGLRRMGHQWGAILLTSALFGLAHGILQQSIGAAVIGVVIGYLAVKSGSLLPGVVYHAVHNGLSVSIGRLNPDAVGQWRPLGFVFETGSEPGELLYRWPAVIFAALIAVGILWWLKRLPYQLSTEEQLAETVRRFETETNVKLPIDRVAEATGTSLVPAIRA
ncbi:MAG TPA: ABC transporter permease subunit/CPBP intramembrane protease [Pirellulaceae bacterium]|jgi:sodium transport system permease protein